MFVQETSWYFIEDADEWFDAFPEAEEIPEEFPVAVQPMATREGIVLSVMTPEIGTYLWNTDSSIGFVLDMENDPREDN